MWREVNFDTLLDWAGNNAKRLNRDIFVTRGDDQLVVSFNEPKYGHYWLAAANGSFASRSKSGEVIQ